MSLRSPLTTALLGAAVLGATACADNSLLTPSDRTAVQGALADHARFSTVALRVSPFFQDESKWLLSDKALDELDLVETPNGQPLAPGAEVGILRPGTRLRIVRVEFPTPLVLAERVIYSPRYSPWVYLEPADNAGPEGAAALALSKGRPLILVLPPSRSANQLLAEVDRYLARQDPRPAVREWTPQVQEAVAHKDLLQGMSPDQVQMAWGYPERIHLDEAQHTQVWTWPFGKQQAFFDPAGLLRWNDHGQTGGATPSK